jgi:hypothetical protein
MRIVRNVSFAALCLILVQLNAPVVLAVCTAPGISGVGATCDEARQACEAEGEEKCDQFCQAGCHTMWLQYSCEEDWPGGGGCTVIGYCICGRPED